MRLPFLPAVPPRDSAMPAFIKLGFTLGDSIAKTSKWYQADSMREVGSDSLTLRMMARTLFAMVDRDPVTFLQWSVDQSYRTQPIYLRSLVTDLVHEKRQDFGRATVLLKADYILRLRIVDTESHISKGFKTVRVTAHVLDTIKGRVHLSGCDPTSTTQGGCIAFEYAPEWVTEQDAPGNLSHGHDKTLATKSGEWIRPESEYLAILSYRAFSPPDSMGFYFTLWPVLFGREDGLFPIVAGRVHDTQNAFGFGTSAPVDQYIAALEALIAREFE